MLLVLRDLAHEHAAVAVDVSREIASQSDAESAAQAASQSAQIAAALDGLEVNIAPTHVTEPREHAHTVVGYQHVPMSISAEPEQTEQHGVASEMASMRAEPIAGARSTQLTINEDVGLSPCRCARAKDLADRHLATQRTQLTDNSRSGVWCMCASCLWSSLART